MRTSSGRSRGFRRLDTFATVAILTGLLSLSPVWAGKALDAGTILERAEEVRSPDVEYAVDFAIRVNSKSGKRPERTGAYSMVVRGKDHTLVLMRAPKQFFGGTLLMTDAGYWLLLPKATKPLELAEAQIITGDVSYGDLARVNLVAGYAPQLAGDEVIDGQPCFKLELAPARARTHYSRIVYWIAKKRFLPSKLEYYGRTGALLKTVWYRDYRKGRLGLRATGFEIEGADDRTSLVFSNLRPIETERLSFTTAGMMSFRDAALLRLPSDGPDVTLENVLGQLPAKAP